MNEVLQAIEQLTKDMNKRFDSVEEKIEQMEKNIAHLAVGSNEDTVKILERIERNTKSLNSDVEFLAGKLGNQERILNRLNNN